MNQVIISLSGFIAESLADTFNSLEKIIVSDNQCSVALHEIKKMEELKCKMINTKWLSEKEMIDFYYTQAVKILESSKLSSSQKSQVVTLLADKIRNI